MSGGRAAVLAALGWVTATLAWADEMLVEAAVVDVVPLGGAAGAASKNDGCSLPRPGPEAGLAELLAWDLRAGCAEVRTRPAGYRVYYRWDGRTYDLVMREPPGETIPLRVRVR